MDEATTEAGRRGWRRIGAGRCWCGRPLRAALLGARPAPPRAVHPTHSARGHTPRGPRPARRRAGRPRVRSPAGSARSPRAGCSAGTPDAGRRVEDAQPQLSLSAPSPLKFPVSASPTARVSFRAAAARVLPSADDSDACPTAARATSASYTARSRSPQLRARSARRRGRSASAPPRGGRRGASRGEGRRHWCRAPGAASPANGVDEAEEVLIGEHRRLVAVVGVDIGDEMAVLLDEPRGPPARDNGEPGAVERDVDRGPRPGPGRRAAAWARRCVRHVSRAAPPSPAVPGSPRWERWRWPRRAPARGA